MSTPPRQSKVSLPKDAAKTDAAVSDSPLVDKILACSPAEDQSAVSTLLSFV
jgi:hypothetical protein